MIPYEELCQSLDRFNARRRNEAELANLDQAPDEGTLDMSQTEDVAAQMPMDDQFQQTAEQDEAPMVDEGGFAEQPKEDTHEIDVDEVMVDDRLAEDKIPGD